MVTSTGSFRTLQYGMLMLASSSPEVADELRAEVAVEGRRPTRPWKEVARAQSLDPDDPCFAFSPGTSKVMGTDGPIEVNTLEYFLGHLKRRIAGGAGGAGLDLYSRMDASSVKPFAVFPFTYIPFRGGGVALFAVCLFLGEVWPRQERPRASRAPPAAGNWRQLAPHRGKLCYAPD